MSGRLSRERWLALGLTALAEGGPGALTIEGLCTRARRTRGSFYHHFAAIDAYRAALAGYWRLTHTEEVIRRTSARRAPKHRLDLLNTLATALDPRIEQGMRRLAAVDAAVAALCREVDHRRIGYLAALYEATGRFTAAEAVALARIEYAAFVGFQVIAPDMKPADSRANYEAFLALTGRTPEKRPPGTARFGEER